MRVDWPNHRMRGDEMAKYSGSCHCGAVNFEVDADLTKGVVCDCTICKRKGAMMVLIDKEQLSVTSGADQLSSYQFNTNICLLYTSPSPRDQRGSRMPSSA